MTYEQKLSILKGRLTVGDCCCEEDGFYADLLGECDGDLDKASYIGCLKNAENSQTKIPGMEMGSQRKYWLSLARLYRVNKSGVIGRKGKEEGQ